MTKSNLLKAIAQSSSSGDYIQQNLPCIAPRNKARHIAGYNANDSLGGYWICPECKEPVTDENGEIIRDKDELYNFKKINKVEEYNYKGLDKDFYINLTQTISNDFSEAISNIDSNDFYDIKDEAYKISENISEKYKIEISKLESDIKAKAKLHQIDPIFPIHNIITCFKYIYNGYDSIKAIILEKIKEVKKRGIEQINSFFDNILDVKEKGQKLEYTVLYPLCYNCSTVCLACGEVVDDIDDMIDYKGNLYCENCAYKCFSCNKVFLNSKKDKFEHAGDVYCEDCFNENFVYCNDCGATIELSTLQKTKSDDFICSRCLDRYYIFCDKCELYVKQSEGIELSDGTVCLECVEELDRCENCEDPALSLNQFYDFDQEEHSYCNSCISGLTLNRCKQCGCLHSFELIDGKCNTCNPNAYEQGAAE